MFLSSTARFSPKALQHSNLHRRSLIQCFGRGRLARNPRRAVPSTAPRVCSLQRSTKQTRLCSTGRGFQQIISGPAAAALQHSFPAKKTQLSTITRPAQLPWRCCKAQVRGSPPQYTAVPKARSLQHSSPAKVSSRTLPPGSTGQFFSTARQDSSTKQVFRTALHRSSLAQHSSTALQHGSTAVP